MKNGKEITQALAMVTQLGLNILAPVVLCAFIGMWLEEKFGWSAAAVLLILGLMAGVRNTWILLKQFQSSDSKRRKKDEQENK